MFRWKNWLKSAPSQARGHNTWIGPAFIAVLLAILYVCACPQLVLAEPDIRVSSLSFEHTFSESLDFGAQISGSAPIVQAVLFYGIEGEPIVRRIYPQVQGAGQMVLSHVESLKPGQFAPGTRLRAWWELEAADGASVTTDEMILDYTHDEHDWESMSQDGMALFWYGDKQDRAQAERILEIATQVVEQLTEEMGVAVEERIDVWVYNTQRDMAPALSQRSDAYDERVLTLGVAVDEDTLLLLGSHRNVELTVAHELSHIVVGIATDNPFVDLPRWLDEGLAMQAEGELPDDNRRALEQAIRDDALLSVRSMTSYAGRPELVDLFYGQAYSILGYLLDERGPDTMNQLLSAFADAQPQEEALLNAYGFGLDELDSRWRQSLGLSPRHASDEISSTRAADALTEPADEDPGRRPVCPTVGLALLAPLAAAVWGKRMPLSRP